MTPAELKVVRESLGVTTKWLAEQANVTEVSVKRWETDYRVPDDVAVLVEGLESEQASQAARYIAACKDVPEPTILTYRVDKDLPDDYPYPASFHRAVVALVAKEVLGLGIEYHDL